MREKFRLVSVDWWRYNPNGHPIHRKDVGWLVEQDDDKIVIAATYDHDNDEFGHKIVIPMRAPVVMIHAGAPKIVGAGVPDTVFDDVHEERVERPLPPEDAPDTGSWPVWTNHTDGTIPGQP